MQDRMARFAVAAALGKPSAQPRYADLRQAIAASPPIWEPSTQPTFETSPQVRSTTAPAGGRAQLSEDGQRSGVPAAQPGGDGAARQDADIAGGGAAGEVAQERLVGRPGVVVMRNGCGMSVAAHGVGLGGERAREPGDGLRWRERLSVRPRSARRPPNGAKRYVASTRSQRNGRWAIAAS
jgi:hypothetical protein